jgi:hypothetical protein
MQVLSQATTWFKAEMGRGKGRVAEGQHVDFPSLSFLLYVYKLIKMNRKRGTESTKRKRKMEIAREMIQGGWKKENSLIGRNEGTGDNLPHGWTPFPCTHCHR